MLRRLRLDKTGKYERAFATTLLARMVVAHVACAEGYRSLGCEQGDIPEWDDLVAEDHHGVLVHYQVKRQTTDFQPQGSPLRKSGASTPLSPLDRAFASLATWSQGEQQSPGQLSRRFVLTTLSSVNVKKGLSIEALAELTDECRKASVTSEGLCLRAKGDERTRRAFAWLTSWCGFTDWGHIHWALRLVTVEFLGNENDLEKRCDDILRPYFEPPSGARELLERFHDDNKSDAGVATPALLLATLRGLLRPGTATWTQYRRDQNTWTICGTNARGSGTIEPPVDTVGAMWTAKQDAELRIVAPPPIGSPSIVEAAIARLALHLPPSKRALLTDHTAWQVAMRVAVGGTLGGDDGKQPAEAWRGCASTSASVDARQIATLSDADGEAASLNSAMDDELWADVAGRVDATLSGMVCADVVIRDTMESTWKLWKTAAGSDRMRRNQMLSRALHPSAEGDDVCARMRAGPLTAHLLCEGIVLLLIVAVALGAGEAAWSKLDDRWVVQVLAMRCWSGVAGRPRSVQRLDDSALDAVGGELASIVLLSGVRESPAALRGDGLADDARQRDSMGAARTPALLTNGVQLRQLTRDGALADLRRYVEGQLEPRGVVRERAIQEAVGDTQ